MSTIPKYLRGNNIKRLRNRKPLYNHNSFYVNIPYEFVRECNITKNTSLNLLWDKDTNQLIIYTDVKQPPNDNVDMSEVLFRI